MRPVPRAFLVLAALAGCRGDEPEMAPPGRNLLLVTVAGLRQDVLEEFCRTRPDGSLASLRRRADVYTECRTPVPSTLAAHCSLFTGVDPWRHGVYLDELFRLGTEWRTLAERLQEQGLTTAACLSTSLLEECHGVLRGFGQIDRPRIETLSLTPLGRDRALPQRRRATPETLAAARPLLAPLRTPFFLWVELEVAPLRRPDAVGRTARELALEELDALDVGLGELLSTLAHGDRGSLTVVALAGVHGECYEGEGGEDYRRSVSEAALHVPLWIAAPAAPKGREHAGPISLTGARELLGRSLGLALGDPPAALLSESVAGWIEAGRPPRFALILEGRKWVLEGSWSRVSLPVDPGDELAAREPLEPEEARRAAKVLEACAGAPALAARLATSEDLEARLAVLQQPPGSVPELPPDDANPEPSPGSGVPRDLERWLAVDPVAQGGVAWQLPVDAVRALASPVPGDRRVQELILWRWFLRPEELRGSIPARDAQEWIDRLAEELPYRAWLNTVAADPAACPDRAASRRHVLAGRAVSAAPYYLPAVRILATVLTSEARADEAARLLQDFGDSAPLGPAAREEFQDRMGRTHVPRVPAGDSR